MAAEGELARLVLEPAVGLGGGAVDAEYAPELFVLVLEPDDLGFALDGPV